MAVADPESLKLVSRVRQKFEKLEETCMERYVTREQRVLSTLNFCMTALEQLHNWALFAIFPLDEQNGDKYLHFVDQRFQCVVGPLRQFVETVEKDFPSASPRKPSPRTVADQGSPREHQLGSAQQQPHQRLGGAIKEQRLRFRDSRTGLSLDSSQTLGSTASSLGSSLGSTGSSGGSVTSRENLREKISVLTRQYLEEGQSARRGAVSRLQKCRKDIRTVYRWGQASLMDLHDVVDEALADELYFLVRGKLTRILSAISAFDEASEQIEKNLSNYFQSTPSTGKDGSDVGGDEVHLELPEFTLDLSASQGALSTGSGGTTSRGESPSPRYETMDMRLDLDELVIDASPHTPRAPGERVEESVDSSRGSTPEPPVSPRPKGLVNHPRIMKDKLHSYALPSKFNGLKFSMPW